MSVTLVPLAAVAVDVNAAATRRSGQKLCTDRNIREKAARRRVRPNSVSRAPSRSVSVPTGTTASRPSPPPSPMASPMDPAEIPWTEVR